MRSRALDHYHRALDLNPRHPGWFHLIPCFAHFHRGEYELALREANRIETLDFYWENLIKASLLGFLGRRDEAAGEAAELLEAVPDFATRRDQLAGLYVLGPPLLHKIHRGLDLAGIS